MRTISRTADGGDSKVMNFSLGLLKYYVYHI